MIDVNVFSVCMVAMFPYRCPKGQKNASFTLPLLPGPKRVLPCSLLSQRLEGNSCLLSFFPLSFTARAQVVRIPGFVSEDQEMCAT